jgi:hypothetical protein
MTLLAPTRPLNGPGSSGGARTRSSLGVHLDYLQSAKPEGREALAYSRLERSA